MGTHIGVGVTLTLIVHVCSYTANGYRIETKTFIVTCVHLSPFIYSQRTDLILPGAKPLFLRDPTIKEILESFLTKTFIFWLFTVCTLFKIWDKQNTVTGTELEFH